MTVAKVMVLYIDQNALLESLEYLMIVHNDIPLGAVYKSIPLTGYLLNNVIYFLHLIVNRHLCPNNCY